MAYLIIWHSKNYKYKESVSEVSSFVGNPVYWNEYVLLILFILNKNLNKYLKFQGKLASGSLKGIRRHSNILKGGVSLIFSEF